MSLNMFWFLPTHGDGHYLGTEEGSRPVDHGYLQQIAQAADRLGYTGVLIPTGRSCEDAWLVEMARSYGLSGIPLFIHVILPGALPSIMVGVRFALGLMWLTLIVAETISANSGIGYLAMNAREFLQTDVVVVAIILYALLGKLADVSAQLLERLWLRWNPAYHLKEATV